MRILAFDSTAKTASVALWQDGRVLAEFSLDSGRTHSEILLPMAENVCARAHLSLSDIDYYATTAGPGSFTGVRIGVATVKGLAFRMEDGPKNCVSVSTLEAIAENLVSLDGIYLPVMDARRDEVYCAIFRMGEEGLVRLAPDRAMSLSDLAAELLGQFANTPVRLCGDGYAVAEKTLSALGVPILPTPMLLRNQNAASVARCAARKIERGETVTDAELSPIYLRVPQAERDRLAKRKTSRKLRQNGEC